ncbi:hypothetical protein OSB04_018447 [Centaurea solstitialis]|uniref:Uncharacterized protein n=1 Tax=Centaurea solstitialis TaxID=347529 RepID=A0AA38WBJ8_9ASTR|nr:hypothetical protein OSB04_018447 [Centaurea solstitialis]
MCSSILPLEEKIPYGFLVLTKKFFNQSSEIYVKNFGKVIQHYCRPASGKPVIMEIAKNLKLIEEEIEAPLMTLHRFGNQCSSSLWYELAYMFWGGLQVGMRSGSKALFGKHKLVHPNMYQEASLSASFLKRYFE